MLSIPKRVLLALVAVLAAVSMLLMWVVQDPARQELRQAFFGYLGDLKQGQGASAAKRVLPDDLAALKQGALDRAGADPVFRQDAEVFFETRDAAAMIAVPRERFFEFLLARTMALHPQVRDVLADGKVVGTGVTRAGDEGELTASFAMDVPEGRRLFSMRLRFKKVDDVWMLRL